MVAIIANLVVMFVIVVTLAAALVVVMIVVRAMFIVIIVVTVVIVDIKTVIVIIVFFIVVRVVIVIIVFVIVVIIFVVAVAGDKAIAPVAPPKTICVRKSPQARPRERLQMSPFNRYSEICVNESLFLSLAHEGGKDGNGQRSHDK